VCALLRDELAAAGVRAQAYGRPKHIYSIWRKMQRKHLAFEQLYDVRAVRVVVDSVADCYAALGVVHARWQMLPGEFDDYIAKPVRREEFMAKVRSMLRARQLIVELETARETVALRNAKLEELEALKETLTQTLVHDLKNPLAAVLGNLELMERKVEEPVLHLVRRSKAAAWRMHQMILNLLDIGQLEEGKLILHPEAVDAVSLARKACQEMEEGVSQRGIRFEIVADEGVAMLKGDGAVLRRVVDNLLSNAIEHSPQGGVVRVAVTHCDEGIEISVADQGPGIPPEHREKIFEKFQRLENRKAAPGANRGLGLTLCRLAVEAHGGTIWVDDAPTGGAVFRVLLPATEADSAADAMSA